MKVALALLAASVGLLTSGLATAAMQPPMGTFEGAFYTCDEGQAFQVSYDSKDPKSAKVTTSNQNKQYDLKRVAAPDSAKFSNGTVNVSVFGEGAKVEGTEIKLTGCKLKNTT
jgi:membrane-bound inhibitor of C-type lysozyme